MVICSDLSLSAIAARIVGRLELIRVLWPGVKVLTSCCCRLLMFSTSSKAKLSKLAFTFHALKTFLALIGLTNLSLVTSVLVLSLRPSFQMVMSPLSSITISSIFW